MIFRGRAAALGVRKSAASNGCRGRRLDGLPPAAGACGETAAAVAPFAAASTSSWNVEGLPKSTCMAGGACGALAGPPGSSSLAAAIAAGSLGSSNAAGSLGSSAMGQAASDSHAGLPGGGALAALAAFSLAEFGASGGIGLITQPSASADQLDKSESLSPSFSLSAPAPARLPLHAPARVGRHCWKPLHAHDAAQAGSRTRESPRSSSAPAAPRTPAALELPAPARPPCLASAPARCRGYTHAGT